LKLDNANILGIRIKLMSLTEEYSEALTAVFFYHEEHEKRKDKW